MLKEKYYDKDAEEMVEYTCDCLEGTRNQVASKIVMYIHYITSLTFYQNMEWWGTQMNELEKIYVCELYPDAENITVEIEDIRNFASYV